MKKNPNHLSAKEHISGKIGFTRDVLLGETIVTIEGDSILFIENYKGILAYTDKCIIIQGRKNKVHIEGKNMQIEYYTSLDMKIKGIFSLVKYC